MVDRSSLPRPIQEPHIEVPQIWIWVPYGAVPLREEVLPQRNAPGKGCREGNEFGKPGPGGPVQSDQQDLLLVLPELAQNCWAKPSTVSPNSPAWEMGASRKRAMSTSFISARLSQICRSWTTMVDIAFPRERNVTFVVRRAKSVAVRSSCINPGSVLLSCTCLSALAW